MSQQISVEEAYSQALKILGDKDTQTSQLGRAIDLLQQIRNTGRSSPQLEANLGKAYAKLENYPRALDHFHKAIEADRLNLSYRKDLSWVQARIPSGLGQPLSHPAEWGFRISSYARPHELFSVSFAALWIFLFILFKKRRLKTQVWLPSCALIVVLFFLSAFSLTASSLALIVSAEQTSLKSAPLQNAEELSLVAPGTRLRILRESGDFVEVERPNAFRGWLSKKDVRRLRD
jgi:tetratricopeptide (TPR) repeat protein